MSEPDVALKRHVERIAADNNVGSAVLVRSLDHVPVLSRDNFRAMVDHLFRMTAAFTAYSTLPGASEIVVPAPEPVIEQVPVVFQAARRRETMKTRRRRAQTLEREAAETEIVRLLRERRSDEAYELLLQLLAQEDKRVSTEGVAAHLTAVEMFTRLFRNMVKGEHVSRSLYNKQANFIAEVLSRKRCPQPGMLMEGLCQDFIGITEEIVGEPRPRKVIAIQKFLKKNLTRKLTLGIVGRKFGLREKPLDALMRKFCGMGFTDYVTSLRIAEAKDLLEGSDCSIGEIAKRTGFKDQSYFTKVFKSHLGSTPTEFRDRTHR